MPAAMGGQAVGRELDVREQLVRALIGVRPSIIGRLDPLADLAEVDSIRHAIVPGGRQPCRARQQRRICIDALGELAAHLDAPRALAQRLRQMPAFVEVGREDHCLMPLQCLADGLRVDLLVALHVSAHPGAEAQNARHVQRFHRNPVGIGERRLDLLVEQRHHPVDDFDQVEQHMFALVGDGEALARVLLGLPDARHFQAHPRPDGLELRSASARRSAGRGGPARCAAACAGWSVAWTRSGAA